MKYYSRHLAHMVTTAVFLCLLSLTACGAKKAPVHLEAQKSSSHIDARKGVIHMEAENGMLIGTKVATDQPGYTGSGYVTNFVNNEDRIEFFVNAVAGIYEIKIRYSTPNGKKGFGLKVNGSATDGMFADTGKKWETLNAGQVELKSGLNTIAITRGWGYFNIDSIEIISAKPSPALIKPSSNPVDPKAAKETKALLKYLTGIYGSHILSGQFTSESSDYIRNVTGKTPAIFGGDLIEYSPTRVQYGSMPKDYTEKVIERSKNGQIITLCWHWNAPSHLINGKITRNGKEEDVPWWKGFYNYGTTFDISQVIDNPASEDYKLMLRDIDTIAVQLKKLQAAHVPVLWRPLHEADGGWFWWGAHGPEPFKKLWVLLYDRLTNYHKLHNLIWVFTYGSSQDWYPGDKYVDIIGIDMYPTDTNDPFSNQWVTLQTRFNGKKMLAISELGGVPNVDKLMTFGTKWAYFTTWNGFETKESQDKLKQTYNNPYVIDQDNLPKALNNR